MADTPAPPRLLAPSRLTMPLPSLSFLERHKETNTCVPRRNAVPRTASADQWTTVAAKRSALHNATIGLWRYGRRGHTEISHEHSFTVCGEGQNFDTRLDRGGFQIPTTVNHPVKHTHTY